VGAYLIALLATGTLAAVITRPFETRFRDGFATYRGLSHVVMAHNYATLSKQFHSWQATDVWEAMKVIIVEQLGVRPECVTRDARFIDDLGLD
jgi:hypothetical protein